MRELLMLTCLLVLSCSGDDSTSPASGGSSSGGASGTGGATSGGAGGASGAGAAIGGGAGGAGGAATGGAGGTGGGVADAGCVDFSACATCLTGPCATELQACDAVPACLSAQFPQADCFKQCQSSAKCWGDLETAGGSAAVALRACAKQACAVCQP